MPSGAPAAVPNSSPRQRAGFRTPVVVSWNPVSSNPQRTPNLIYFGLYFRRHLDPVGPFGVEAFRRQLPGAVEADLGAESQRAGGVVQHVDRAADEAHVALRVDVVPEPPEALL